MMPKLYVCESDEDVMRYAHEQALLYAIHGSNCFHFYPEKSIITIDQAREIQSIAQQAQMPTLIVIHSFESAREDTQNALLKSLEEYTKYVCFVLAVTDDSGVLATIRSRCETVRAYSAQVASTTLMEKYAIDHAHATGDAYLAASTGVSKDDGILLIDEIIAFYHSMFEENATLESGKALREIVEIRRHVQISHVQLESALDMVGNSLVTHAIIPAS